MFGLIIPLAHHPLLVAIPFVGPALAISAGLAFLALRERIRGDGHGHRRRD